MLRAGSAAIKPGGVHDLSDAKGRHAMWGGRRDETGSRQHPAMSGRSCVRDATFGMTGHEAEESSRDGKHNITRSLPIAAARRS